MGLFKPNVERLERKKNVEGLIKALKDKDESMRKAAENTLKEIEQVTPE